jgi:hypothetical protein
MQEKQVAAGSGEVCDGEKIRKVATNEGLESNQVMIQEFRDSGFRPQWNSL